MGEIPISLFVCLFLVLVFEFINGFHDTANAVATVIYTNTLKPIIAVLLSGLFNFLGVMLGGLSVAYGVLHLLPIESLIQGDLVDRYGALLSILNAAIIWNLLTWYVGLPCSSSHTLLGSLTGVAIGSAFLPGHNFGEAMKWQKVSEAGLSLLLSPVIGCIAAGGLYVAARKLIPNEQLFSKPDVMKPPPLITRALLISTCMGVSFAHGSNDGQKGIGMILLILILGFPDGYAFLAKLDAGQLAVTVPSWIIMVVAVTLGLGTMIGWKRVVVTVGEKIGNSHLSYAQGASAELVAASTIGLSSLLGLPVSTTHVLSSGIAGTMIASKAGVQRSTITKILSAWIFTLPVSALLSFGLFRLIHLILK
jgi:phosphate/sulfate permease